MIMFDFDSPFETAYVWMNLGVNSLIYGYFFAKLLMPRAKNWLFSALGYAVTVITGSIIIKYYCAPMGLLYTIFMSVVFFGSLFLFFKNRLRQYVFSMFVLYCLNICTEIVANSVMVSLGCPLYLSSIQKNGYMIIGVVISNMLALVLVLLFLAIYKAVTEHISQKQLLAYIVFPLYQGILLFCFYIGAGEYDWKDAVIGVLITVFSLVVDIIIINAVDNMAQSLHMDDQMLAVQLQRQTEQEYRQLTEEHILQMKSVRQELSDQIRKVYQLLEAEEKDAKIKDVLQDSMQRLQSTKVRRYCENSVVNSILTVKKENAEEHGIDMKIGVSVPEYVTIVPIDLCSLFSNLLDNAIEACDQLPENAGQKVINIKAAIQAGFLIVKTENTYCQPVQRSGEVIKTSKQDQVNHGYGLQLVRRIADQYEGQINIEYDGMIFRVLASMIVT
ncbi:MAG: ATP-binding protein [bacterium]|nr:ATP-binding protein [bacterium]